MDLNGKLWCGYKGALAWKERMEVELGFSFEMLQGSLLHFLLPTPPPPPFFFTLLNFPFQ